MLTKLLPNIRVQSIYDINTQKLWDAGIRGIITDLDNTLVGARAQYATPELIVWLQAMEELGFQVIIVSNNSKRRVAEFADPLGIAYVPSARKPKNRPFQKALTMLNLKREQVAVIGDQMLTDVLGGNRMGLYTILVAPVVPKEDGVFTMVNRQLERAALGWMKLRGKNPWEDRV